MSTKAKTKPLLPTRAPSSSAIDVFCRVRPPGANTALNYQSDPDDTKFYTLMPETAQLALKLPQRYRLESANAQTEHSFTFNGLFPLSVTQEFVFRSVALPRINDCLDGFNACIFAYGQTGSGKTHTMSGGATSYDNRGLVPRSLEYLFDKIANDTSGDDIAVSVSYMQVYMNAAYDLLSGDATTRDVDLSSLTRVRFLEDHDRVLHLRGLSMRSAASAAAALETLFIGDCNRVVASTLQNNVSSRSHAVFAVHVTRRKSGSSMTTTSKLNFVDLAGSERVSRTLADGTVLQEAQYINGSLFQLERVIHALNARAPHVPYRSSLITLVLRDSLGGNCKSSMIACIAVEPDNIADSVSTCRFAMRVAEIKNRAVINDNLDLSILVRRLKAENRLLRAELASMKGLSESTELTDDDRAACRALVAPFAIGETQEVAVTSSGDVMQECFRQLRDILRASSALGPAPIAAAATTAAAAPAAAPASASSNEPLDERLERLTLLLEQRDAEIEILTDALSRIESEPLCRPCTADTASEFEIEPEEIEQDLPLPAAPTTAAVAAAGAASQALALCNISLSDIPLEYRSDASKLFELFCSHSPVALAAAGDAAELAHLAADAAEGADALRDAKAAVENLRHEVEYLERTGDSRASEQAQALAEQRGMLRDAMDGMRALKTRIEGMQQSLRHANMRVQSDFALWVDLLAQQVDEEEESI